MIRNLEVSQVDIRGMVGWQVQGLYRDCSDSLYEVVAHAAVFRDKARAERFLEVVRSKPSWEWQWAHWGAPAGSYFSGVEAMQSCAPVYSVL